MNIWFDVIVVAGVALLNYIVFRIYQQGAQIEQDEILVDESGNKVKTQQRPSLGFFPERMIRQAGFIPKRIQYMYWFGKLVLVVLLPMIGMEIVQGKLPLGYMILLALIGYFVLDLWLLIRRSRRRRRIEDTLSYFMDLMVAFLQSGMNLSQAFRQSAEFGLPQNNPLAKEVMLVSRELDAGRDRIKALTDLAERTGVHDLHKLAAVMNIGFQVGSPIGNTMSSQAELLRAKQWERETEKLNRKSVKMLLPMTLISFPVLFVLVFFPAAVQLKEAFRMLSGSF